MTRRRDLPRCAALACLLASATCAARAHGQDARRVVVISVPAPSAPPARISAWQRRIEAGVRRTGAAALTDVESWSVERTTLLGPILETRLAVLAAVDADIVRARELAAHLEEERALGILAEAERRIEANADVPGMAPLYAEVELALGLVAAQAGLTELSRASLRRALTVDPERGLRAAEAPPLLVAEAETLARDVATGPDGSFEVTVDANGARVFLDDVELGPLPRSVRAPVGRHVLRIEAPGRRPYGTMLDVLEGVRAPLVVALAYDPIVEAARALTAAARRDDPRELSHALAQLTNLDAAVDLAWIVVPGGGPEDRAILTACRAEGCGSAEQLEAATFDELVVRRGEHMALALRPSTRPLEALAWLDARRLAPPPPPLWKRWYVWTLAGIGLAAATSGAIVVGNALTPAPDHVRRVDITP